MKTARDIVLGPVISEKSIKALGLKKYTFKVAKNANKIEIAKAVEEIFDVKVDKVNTMHCRGQKRRMGLHEGVTPSWKKAVVTLNKDSKGIEFFESMM